MSTADFLDFLPYFAQGTVVKGFGRGSSELGIPTANFPEDVIHKLPEAFACGVYYGWACVNTLTPATVHKMVMCIGYNPHYQNKIKTMETHVMHQFKNNFYGENLRIIIMGYIRPMSAFQSRDALIVAMNEDIRYAESSLEESDFRSHPYLTSTQISSSLHSLANLSLATNSTPANLSKEVNVSGHTDAVTKEVNVSGHTDAVTKEVNESPQRYASGDTQNSHEEEGCVQCEEKSFNTNTNCSSGKGGSNGNSNSICQSTRSKIVSNHLKKTTSSSSEFSVSS